MADATMDRSRGLRWGAIVGAAIGLVVGLSLGIESQRLGSGYEGGLPRNLGTTAVTFLAVGGLVLSGLALAVPRATRAAGIGALAAAGAVVLGFAIGGLVVPANPGAQTLSGSVRLELTAPRVEQLEGPAECTTPEVEGRAFIISADLGSVGRDDLRLLIVHFNGQASASVSLRVNDRTGYQGAAPLAEVGTGQRSGRGEFTALQSRNGWIGGVPDAGASGSFSWNCSE